MEKGIKVNNKEISFEDLADGLCDGIDTVLLEDFHLNFAECNSLNYRGILAEIGKIWTEQWKDEPLYREIPKE